MAINYSTNKIRVSRLLQTDAIVGLMNPEVGMMTDHGKILSVDAGGGQVTVGVGENAMAGNGTVKKKFYPHDLKITYAEAVSNWNFPSASGAKAFGGHGQTWPNGVQAPAPSKFHIRGDSTVGEYTRTPNIVQ